MFIFGETWGAFFFLLPSFSGPVLESKGMRAIFQKKSKGILKKKEKYLKFGQKCTKFESILEKGSLL